jgi:hypothetical protein
LVSFFIPIGFHGTDGVDDYIYTWVSTVDSIRIKYILIERVISIYLLLSLVIAYVYTMITWHVGAQTISSCFGRYNPKATSFLSKLPGFSICALVGIATITAGIHLNEDMMFKVYSLWLQIRLPFEMLFVLFVFILSKWKRGLKL